MSEAWFYMQCGELRPYLTKQSTKLRKNVPVETHAAVTQHYFADEGDFTKFLAKVHSTS